MKNQKEQASKIQDLLTLCLASACNRAFTAIHGRRWFPDFKLMETEERFPIIPDYKNSIYDCDFQALLKIIYYRKMWARDLLNFYGVRNAISSDDSNTPFQRTVYRLINDYRNKISAHISAQKIRDNLNGQENLEGYDYSDAIRDMLKVARIFRSVKDDKGRSYYRQIVNIANGYNTTVVLAVLICFIAAAIIAVAFLIITNFV